ncbi:MAG: ATP-binding cassette domain-containing protein [Bacteroidota bacterium]
MSHKLEVDSVMLGFGLKTILSDIYMCFETGSVTGILGRNGSGKSCLLKIMYGTMTAQYSNVRYDGRRILSGYKHPEMIRFLPQSDFIPKHLALGAVLDLFSCDRQWLTDLFPEFSGYLHQPFRQFSFGQKRLIETCLVLNADADFIMLDEPFSFLMPIHVERLKGVIRKIKTTKGIIITDHLYRELLDITDRNYLIHDGASFPVTDESELRMLGYIH